MDETSNSQTIPQFPEPSSTETRNRMSTSPDSSRSSTSSASDSERPSSQRSRFDRPKMTHRQKSSSIIIDKGKGTVQTERPEYPPDDARAMSPRRSSQDLERLGHDMRQTLKEQARTLQSSLAALAEKIDEVKSDHDKLETENRFLQDYIGGLTRTMSKEHVASTSGKGKKK